MLQHLIAFEQVLLPPLVLAPEPGLAPEPELPLELALDSPK